MIRIKNHIKEQIVSSKYQIIMFQLSNIFNQALSANVKDQASNVPYKLP